MATTTVADHRHVRPTVTPAPRGTIAAQLAAITAARVARAAATIGRGTRS